MNKLFIYILSFIICTACGNLAKLNLQKSNKERTIVNDKKSVDEKSVDKKSVDEKSVDKKSVDEKSVDEKSVDKKSVDKNKTINADDDITSNDNEGVADEEKEREMVIFNEKQELTKEQKKKKEEFEKRGLEKTNEFLEKCKVNQKKKLSIAKYLDFNKEDKEKIKKSGKEVEKEILKLIKEKIKINFDSKKNKTLMVCIFGLLKSDNLFSEEDIRDVTNKEKKYKEQILKGSDNALNSIITDEQKIKLFYSLYLSSVFFPCPSNFITK